MTLLEYLQSRFLMNARRNIPSLEQIGIDKHVVAHLRTDGVVLLNTRKGLMFSSGAAGARVWQGIKDGTRTEEVAARISQECGVDRAAVRKDIEDFVVELRSQGLVYVRPVPQC
jgi:hypothetical protein